MVAGHKQECARFQAEAKEKEHIALPHAGKGQLPHAGKGHLTRRSPAETNKNTNKNTTYFEDVPVCYYVMTVVLGRV